MKLSKIQITGAFLMVGILIIMMFNTVISSLIKVINKSTNESNDTINIDYKKLYPFTEENDKTNKEENNIINKYKSTIQNIEGQIEKSTSERLIGYEKFIENSYIYNKLIGYNLVSNSSNKARIKIDDEYFSIILNNKDITGVANNLIEFNEYLEDLNINLLYIQAPYKISETQRISSIYKDYSNENMNNFLKEIEGKVKYVDLRKNIKDNNLNHLELFYKTDHHWLPQTGLWATNQISQYLNDNYNMNLEISNINPEKFNVTTYKEMFLGSDGRYVSLANAKPENFDLITPKYNTELTIRIPDKGIYKTDTYENTIIEWSRIKYENYYNINQYAAYAYGDRPLIEIHNELVNNNKRILLIRDSFSEVVVPFLALENEYLSVIDLRHFDGSLKTYINEYKPDLVIIMYNGNVIIDLNTNTTDNEIINMWRFD